LIRFLRSYTLAFADEGSKQSRAEQEDFTMDTQILLLAVLLLLPLAKLLLANQHGAHMGKYGARLLLLSNLL